MKWTILGFALATTIATSACAEGRSILAQERDVQEYHCIFYSAKTEAIEAYRVLFAGTDTIGSKVPLSSGGEATRLKIGRGEIINPDGTILSGLYAVGGTDGEVTFMDGSDLVGWIRLSSGEASLGSRSDGRCYPAR